MIERPVAVVKELVENSLDAEAERIEIEFNQGGKRYIRVEDDGTGMSADDALLALERHATSKIAQAGDLNTVRSFGFRGEALPSIASVSHFTLRTRTADQAEGTEIQVRSGKLVTNRACGMPPGTRIEVANLFQSLPGRRKFLKTDQTEAAHIVQMVRLLSVAHWKRSFTMVENGRQVLHSPVCAMLRDRIFEVWGAPIAENLLELDAASDGIRVTGMIGKPGLSRATRHELVTLVNQRPVDNRTLSYALIEAYHMSIPRGRYPVAFLLLDIDPARVDVNVHPAKREVRFREESRVRNAVITAVLERLRKHTEATRSIASDPARKRDSRDPIPGPTVPDHPRPEAGEGGAAESPARPAAAPPAPKPADNRARAMPRSAPSPASAARLARPECAAPSRLNWRYLGKMVHGFILFETGNGLVLLDPEAARRRIRYESIRAQFQAEVPASQRLLLPLALDLEPPAAAALEENLGFLNANGFRIEPFGRNFFRVEALPPWLEPGDGESFLRDLIGQVRQQGLSLQTDRPDLAHEFLARLATRRGRDREQAGTGESASQFMLLAEQLLRCRDPLADPAGKATFVELSRGELEKRFGRR